MRFAATAHRHLKSKNNRVRSVIARTGAVYSTFKLNRNRGKSLCQSVMDLACHLRTLLEHSMQPPSLRLEIDEEGDHCNYRQRHRNQQEVAEVPPRRTCNHLQIVCRAQQNSKWHEISGVGLINYTDATHTHCAVGRYLVGIIIFRWSMEDGSK